MSWTPITTSGPSWTTIPSRPDEIIMTNISAESGYYLITEDGSFLCIEATTNAPPGAAWAPL